MNNVERRALYNLLRMNWLREPALSVESWQVEDYRSLPLTDLFSRLASFNICLDRLSFIGYADVCDSPEELTEHLIGDNPLTPSQEDQIYLILFEVWRRLMSEKPSLSIICNELDYQIHLYDQNQLTDLAALQDALFRFVQILDENADQGIPAEEVLSLIGNYCANDIETFLYDFISEQIEEENEAYVSELLDNFGSYLEANKWFKLLKIRLCDPFTQRIAHKMIEEMIEDELKDEDLDFNLEFLSLMSEKQYAPFFRLIMKQTIPLVKCEEDLQDLVGIAIEFFQKLNFVDQAAFLKTCLAKRTHLPLSKPIPPKEQDLIELSKLF